MARVIILALMLISANPYYLGSIAYAAVIALVFYNVFTTKYSHQRLLALLLFISYYIINFIYVFSQKAEFDPVVLNFFVQMLFLLTVNYSNISLFRTLYFSMQLQVGLSVLLGLVGFMTGGGAMFVDAGSAKGFSGFYALTGLFATPQLLSSVSLAVVLFSKTFTKKITLFPFFNFMSALSYITMLVSLNRINLLGVIALKFLAWFKDRKDKHILIFLLPLLIMLLFFILLSVIDLRSVDLQTINSRLALFSGVLSTINLSSIWQLIFGSFSKIHFYLREYIVDIYYVENGFLFLFKYFGSLGLLIYFSIAIFFVVYLYKKNMSILALYTFFYLFIVQNFTNEYVSFVFPQILSLIIFRSLNFPNKYKSYAHEGA
ncbi:hypothetical protein [Pluralibacter gergoviae]|uniref:hypothetical protein n=1 Tax=Pluralibacter gergoviae TaxID=61647 RepID=UPI000A5FC7B4|nr:hypothetical protein [Pluralibacter gergoviae]